MTAVQTGLRMAESMVASKERQTAELMVDSMAASKERLTVDSMVDSMVVLMVSLWADWMALSLAAQTDPSLADLTVAWMECLMAVSMAHLSAA